MRVRQSMCINNMHHVHAQWKEVEIRRFRFHRKRDGNYVKTSRTADKIRQRLNHIDKLSSHFSTYARVWSTPRCGGVKDVFVCIPEDQKNEIPNAKKYINYRIHTHIYVHTQREKQPHKPYWMIRMLYDCICIYYYIVRSTQIADKNVK